MVDEAVRIVLSREGVRMGCPLGSLGFDLALQSVLEHCASSTTFPGVIVRSPTDDCNLAIQLPAEPGDAAAALGQLKDALDSLSGQAHRHRSIWSSTPPCALLLRGDMMREWLPAFKASGSTLRG